MSVPSTIGIAGPACLRFLGIVTCEASSAGPLGGKYGFSETSGGFFGAISNSLFAKEVAPKPVGQQTTKAILPRVLTFGFKPLEYASALYATIDSVIHTSALAFTHGQLKQRVADTIDQILGEPFAGL
jgi:hypothetical protein